MLHLLCSNPMYHKHTIIHTISHTTLCNFALVQVGGQLAGKHVVAVAAGREHAVVATDDGSVYTWGGRDVIAGRAGPLDEPGKVEGDLAGDKVLFVAAGEVRAFCVI